MFRILMTTAWYPNRKVAGDGVFVQKHARAIARLDDVAVLMVQTDVAVAAPRVDVEGAWAEVDGPGAEGRLYECRVYVPKVRREVPLLTGLLRLWWLWVGYVKGYRHIKRHCWDGRRPDVCHVNVLTRAAMLPLVLRAVRGVPYIVTEHWTRYHRPDAFPSGRLHLWATRLAVRRASYVCPVGLALERGMKRWGLNNRRYVRVGNVVDTATFSLATATPLAQGGARAAGRPADGRCRLVHVSWMRDETKNVSGILRVLARLGSTRRDWHLDLVGEGNDKARLLAMATELGLTTQASVDAPPVDTDLVSFCPAVSGQVLADVLRAHDGLLMFSNYENQPVSVLEALACGLPVVATAAGDVALMLAAGRGLTVPVGDEQALLDVLTAFVGLVVAPSGRDDEALRAQRHAYVAAHHSPDVIGRQFDVLYSAALRGA